MKKGTSYIDLSLLAKLTKGDKVKRLYYLQQFLDIIPKKLIELKVHMLNQNHAGVRLLVHYIGPHLMFFGVPEVKEILIIIENGVKSGSIDEELEAIGILLVNSENAVQEVNALISERIN